MIFVRIFALAALMLAAPVHGQESGAAAASPDAVRDWGVLGEVAGHDYFYDNPVPIITTYRWEEQGRVLVRRDYFLAAESNAERPRDFNVNTVRYVMDPATGEIAVATNVLANSAQYDARTGLHADTDEFAEADVISDYGADHVEGTRWEARFDGGFTMSSGDGTATMLPLTQVNGEAARLAAMLDERGLLAAGDSAQTGEALRAAQGEQDRANRETWAMLARLAGKDFAVFTGEGQPMGQIMSFRWDEAEQALVANLFHVSTLAYGALGQNRFAFHRAPDGRAIYRNCPGGGAPLGPFDPDACGPAGAWERSGPDTISWLSQRYEFQGDGSVEIWSADYVSKVLRPVGSVPAMRDEYAELSRRGLIRAARPVRTADMTGARPVQAASSPAAAPVQTASRPAPSRVDVIAATGPRLALVIGNGDYGAGMGRLPNPVRDAELIAETLREVGFDVEIVTDVGQNDMKRAIRRLGERMERAGEGATGLFYYAGHGVQSRGVNYLIPVGAPIEREADLEIEAVAADTVLRQMEAARVSTNIIVLDACRNMPLARSFRDGSRGLARMEAPNGSFIAYSTSPGSVAADGEGANSPFAMALSRQIQVPGRPIEVTFRNVRRSVLEQTDGMQVPWDSSSLIDTFMFAR